MEVKYGNNNIDIIYSIVYDIRRSKICLNGKNYLVSYGYIKHGPRGGSSHYTFRKPGRNPITIPMHEPIKKVYIKLVKEAVEGEIENENIR